MQHTSSHRMAVIAIVLTVVLAGVAAQLETNVKCGQLDELAMYSLDDFVYPTEHQWLARIIYSKGDNRAPTGGCVGVLISKRNLLAPADCFMQHTAELEGYSVQLGVWNWSANAHELNCVNGYCVLPAQEIELDEIAIYPDYDPLTLNHNLAVLTMQKEAKLSMNIMPICLPPPAVINDSMIGRLLFIGGFPARKHLKSKRIMKAISHRWCLNSLHLFTTNNTICGFLREKEFYHHGAALVGIQVETQTDMPTNFFLVGIQMGSSTDVKSDRIMSNFVDVRPYMNFIRSNSILD